MMSYPRPLPDRPPDDPRMLFDAVYENLRADCSKLEHLLQHATENGTLAEKELKRLDKSVVVMKVGFKLLKKALKVKRAAMAA